MLEAEERAQRLRREAEFLLSQELKQLRVDLERELAESAIAAATQTLVESASAGDQERLAETYLDDLRAAAGGKGKPS